MARRLDPTPGGGQDNKRHAYSAGWLVARAQATRIARLYPDELRLMEREAVLLLATSNEEVAKLYRARPGGAD